MTGKRGGPGRGQGRPPVKPGEPTVTMCLRMTQAQRDKVERLGGAAWVRDRIDRAKEPNAKLRGAIDNATTKCTRLPSVPLERRC